MKESQVSKLLSDDPATHNIADNKSSAAAPQAVGNAGPVPAPVSDDPAIHDIADDKNHGLISDDTTTGAAASGSTQPYTGPVQGLQNEYINVTSDHLNISCSTDDWFIHSGGGDDAIAVHGGSNVLDGGTGSNFLTGGTGTDTFFVDDRGASSDIWSTVVGFHAGDSATIWGVTPRDFGLDWADGQGAAGFTGLTLHATAASKPTASLTLAGYSQADMANGRLSVSFGNDPASGSAYMSIHANS
jgi:Ca2+-binding RTX toxin-like protein